MDPLLSRSQRYPLANYRISLTICTFPYLLLTRWPVHFSKLFCSSEIMIHDPVFFVLLFLSSTLRISSRCLLQFLTHLNYYSACMWNNLLTFHTSGILKEWWLKKYQDEVTGKKQPLASAQQVWIRKDTPIAPERKNTIFFILECDTGIHFPPDIFFLLLKNSPFLKFILNPILLHLFLSTTKWQLHSHSKY